MLKKLKYRKAPGPDGITTDILKELDEDLITELNKLITEWWTKENIPEEELRARVVLIYKKGDTNKYGNYRPISLLDASYKLYAALLQKIYSVRTLSLKSQQAHSLKLLRKHRLPSL